MWKRRLAWLLPIILGAVALDLYFEPTRCVRGWLHGEAFYDGRPTSYWRIMVVDALDIDWPNFPGDVSWWERMKMRAGFEPRYTAFHLAADVGADPVLQTLAEDNDAHVAAFAQDVLKSARPGDDFNKKQKYYFDWLDLIKKHNRRR